MKFLLLLFITYFALVSIQTCKYTFISHLHIFYWRLSPLVSWKRQNLVTMAKLPFVSEKRKGRRNWTFGISLTFFPPVRLCFEPARLRRKEGKIAALSKSTRGGRPAAPDATVANRLSPDHSANPMPPMETRRRKEVSIVSL